MNVLEALLKSKNIKNEDGEFEVESIAILGKKRGVRISYEEALFREWETTEKTKRYPALFRRKSDGYYVMSQYPLFEDAEDAILYSKRELHGFTFVRLIKDIPELINNK
jgi:hypothetical protein